MDNNNTNNTNKVNGIATIISLLLVSAFLLFTNGYFLDKTNARIPSIIFMVIAFLGLSVEVNNAFDMKKLNGILDIFLGVSITFGLIYLLKLSNNEVSKMFIVIILVLPVYGAILGFIKLFKNITIQNIKEDNIVKKIFLIITQLLTFALTVLQILKIFKIIQ